jgi:hypothetical protein
MRSKAMNIRNLETSKLKTKNTREANQNLINFHSTVYPNLRVRLKKVYGFCKGFLRFSSIFPLNKLYFEGLFPFPPVRTLSDFLKMQDSLLKESAKELLRTDLLHQTQSQIAQHVEYPPNSCVLVHYRDGSPPSRLHTHWRDLLKVVRGGNSRYTLYDLITQKSLIYHVPSMKPFLYDPAITNPLDVARHDHMEYFVEDIYPQSPRSSSTFPNRVFSQMAKLPRV